MIIRLSKLKSVLAIFAYFIVVFCFLSANDAYAAHQNPATCTGWLPASGDAGTDPDGGAITYTGQYGIATGAGGTVIYDLGVYAPDEFVGNTNIGTAQFATITGDWGAIEVGTDGTIFLASAPWFSYGRVGGGDDILIIDPATGTQSILVSIPTNGGGFGDVIATDDGSALYVTNLGDGLIYSIDVASSSATPLFDHGLYGRPDELLDAVDNINDQSNWPFALPGAMPYALELDTNTLYYSVLGKDRLWPNTVTYFNSTLQSGVSANDYINSVTNAIWTVDLSTVSNLDGDATLFFDQSNTSEMYEDSPVLDLALGGPDGLMVGTGPMSFVEGTGWTTHQGNYFTLDPITSQYNAYYVVPGNESGGGVDYVDNDTVLIGGEYNLSNTQPWGFGVVNSGGTDETVIDQTMGVFFDSTGVFNSKGGSFDVEYVCGDAAVVPGSIVGQVAHVDGDPVEGAMVTLTDSTGMTFTTITNADGNYTFTTVISGTATVVVDPSTITAADGDNDAINSDTNDKDPSTVTMPDPINVTSGLTSTVDTMTVDEIMLAVGMVVGAVTHVDGDPIAGASVGLFDASGFVIMMTTTDAAGNYTFTDVPQGTGYEVVVDPASITAPDGADTDIEDKDPNSVTNPSSFDVMGGETSTVETATVAEIPELGDGYEDDDNCADAKVIGTDGVVQAHTFHDVGDVDWVKFEGEVDVTYQLLGLSELNSPSDLVVEIYFECDATYDVEQSHSFAPDVRLGFEAPISGTYYIKVYNQQGSVHGDHVAYTLSVQAEAEEQARGMAVIVAGRQGEEDDLQSNIHFVTDEVYRLFAERGYPTSRIHYLATDLDLDPPSDGDVHVDAVPSLANLEQIINDNLNQLGDGVPLTLYMMSHGLRDELFFDGENGEAITPADLDALLTSVESAVPGVVINVVIDACYSGSFISPDDELGQTLSKPGRLIVTSASEWKLAWASPRGAYFSDFFINALRMEYSVAEAFRIAERSIDSLHIRQSPKLDDNGNSIGNDLQDGAVASERGFGFGNFGISGEPDNWIPYITEIDAVSVSGGTAELSLQVLDDKGNEAIDTVWAVLIPPSYVEPTADNTAESGDLILDHFLTMTLTATTGGYYTGISPALAELGEYEVVFYAQDKESALARPVSTTFTNDTTIPLNIGLSRVNTQTTLILLIVVCLFTGGLITITLHRHNQE